MKKVLMLVLVLAVSFASNGCVSYLTMRESKEQVAQRRARIAEDDVAIRSFENGARHSELGYEITNIDAILERPVQQGLALGADALLIWGGYEGIQWLSNQGSIKSSSSSKKQEQDVGRDNISITVEGDGNQVEITGDSFSQETPVVVN